MDRQLIGRKGEELAAAILAEKGYEILAANFRCRLGEIDIIARKGRVICFVEVKTRLSDRYGLGRDALTKEKCRHIKNVSEYFLKTSGIYYDSVQYQLIEIMCDHIEEMELKL